MTSSDMYKIEGVDHCRYVLGREEALKACRKLNSIPAGKPFAGTYKIELVTDPFELARVNAGVKTVSRR